MDNKIKQLRTIGLFEGLSYLTLLFIAMPLKYFAGLPIAVKVAGMIHGLLFVAYVLAGARAAKANGWKFTRMAQVILASVLPFGPFVFDRSLSREEAQRSEL